MLTADSYRCYDDRPDPQIDPLIGWGVRGGDQTVRRDLLMAVLPLRRERLSPLVCGLFPRSLCAMRYALCSMRFAFFIVERSVLIAVFSRCIYFWWERIIVNKRFDPFDVIIFLPVGNTRYKT